MVNGIVGCCGALSYRRLVLRTLAALVCAVAASVAVRRGSSGVGTGWGSLGWRTGVSVQWLAMLRP